MNSNAAPAASRRAPVTALLALVDHVRRRIIRGIGRELLVFGAIGIASTAAYAAVYVVLRSSFGPVGANALALVLTAVANTAANRRLTFGVRDRASMARDQAGGLVALAIALAITTVTANLLGVLAPHAGRAVELVALTTANALATVARFLLLRTWIAGDRRAHDQRALAASANPTAASAAQPKE